MSCNNDREQREGVVTSVVLTCCPPAPLLRYTSIRMSLSSTFTSSSVASGNTATVTVLVWTRPFAEREIVRVEEENK
jgi:hypothetical protein